jgi:CDP-alcohol phosphatidyltransferase-like enzyme
VSLSRRLDGGDELVRPRSHFAVAVGDPAGGVRRPADGDALVADRDVGVVVLGLGELGEPVDEGDRGHEGIERELALERAADLAPTLGRGHAGKYRASRKQTPTSELLCELVYRPLGWLAVRALLPLRVPPPAVVLAGLATGLAAAVELARGELVIAAALLVAKTVLDGADGMLARAAGRVTALGRYLDSEADLAVNAALFAALGYATGRALLAAAAFLVLTLVLSVNFNLRRLYQLEHGRSAQAMPHGGGPFRRLYELVYAPQDRAIERFVEWRLRRTTDAGRRAYHDRGSLVLLHNLGLATQHSALAAVLVAGRPSLEFLIVFVCGLALVPLELRRGLRAATAGEPAPVRV